MIIKVVCIELVVDSTDEEVWMIRDVEVTYGGENIGGILSDRMDEKLIAFVE